MSIIKLSKQIADPRIEGRTVHKMEHIIYITIAAVIAGAQSWNEIAEFGKSKLDFFKKRMRSEEHTSELQSRFDLVCRLLLEKKKLLPT